MRESWIPLFQNIRNSSLWALDSDIRIVWFTLLTMADPEGYVGAAIPGLAVAANVPVEKVRQAIALFEAPDPDSRSTEHEGRRIQKVPRGWLILTYADHQARARHEADKARKRRWAREHYQPANDNDVDLDGPSENLDASKSKSKSDLPSEGEMIPPDPPVLPTVLRTIPDDWQPSEELIVEAAAQGLNLVALTRRLAELRAGPIGGSRGVLAHKLDDYVRRQLPKWRAWDEADRAKAQRAAQAPRGGPGGMRYAPTAILEANEEQRAFAAKHGLDLDGELRRLNAANIVESLGSRGAVDNLTACLKALAGKKYAGRTKPAR